jgi:hypothetical protein
MNCWEFMKCPKETYENCPAYPDRGQDCWKITGTKCERGTIEKKKLEEKIAHCRSCDFFNKHAHRY